MSRYGGRGRVVRAARALLAQNNLAMLAINEEIGLIDWKRLRGIVPSPMVTGALREVAHPWTVYGVACCRDQDGETYVKIVELSIKNQHHLKQIQGHQNCDGCRYCKGLPKDSPHRVSPLQQFLNENVDSCNSNHLVKAGYIATPYESYIDPETIHYLFEQAGAWKPTLGEENETTV